MIPTLRHGALRSVPLDVASLGKHEYIPQLLRLRFEYQKLQGMLCAYKGNAYSCDSFAQSCRNIPSGWFFLQEPIENQNDANEFLVRLVDRLGEAFPDPIRSLHDVRNIDATPNAASASVADPSDSGPGNPMDGQAATRVASFASKESSSGSNLFSGILQGSLCNELRGIDPEYPHYRSSEEAFFTVQLSLKNADSIEDALNHFIEGDRLVNDNAYFCEKYDKKVDTVLLSQRFCV